MICCNEEKKLVYSVCITTIPGGTEHTYKCDNCEHEDKVYQPFQVNPQFRQEYQCKFVGAE